MTDFEFANRAAVILHELSLERKGWRQLLKRWYVSDEPLRNDAANLLRERGWVMLMPDGFQRVGDDRDICTALETKHE
jgi:hypothetical protein